MDDIQKRYYELAEEYNVFYCPCGKKHPFMFNGMVNLTGFKHFKHYYPNLTIQTKEVLRKNKTIREVL